MKNSTVRNGAARWGALVTAFLLVLVGLQGVVLYRLHRKTGPAAPPESSRVARPDALGRMELAPRAAPGARTPDAPDPSPSPVPPPLTPPPLTALQMNPEAMAQDPLAEMRRIQEEMTRVLEETLQRFQSVPVPPAGSTNLPSIAPRLDLTDEGDVYVVHVDMPGVRKADISVQINGRTVTVSTRSAGTYVEQKDAANRVIRRERRSGVFRRSFDLPGPVVQEQMKANYEDGVLTITVPKAKMDQDPTRTIPVI